MPKRPYLSVLLELSEARLLRELETPEFAVYLSQQLALDEPVGLRRLFDERKDVLAGSEDFIRAVRTARRSRAFAFDLVFSAHFPPPVAAQEPLNALLKRELGSPAPRDLVAALQLLCQALRWGDQILRPMPPTFDPIPDLIRTCTCEPDRVAGLVATLLGMSEAEVTPVDKNITEQLKTTFSLLVRNYCLEAPRS